MAFTPLGDATDWFAQYQFVGRMLFGVRQSEGVAASVHDARYSYENGDVRVGVEDSFDSPVDMQKLNEMN